MKRIAMGDGTFVFNGDDVSYELPKNTCNVSVSELEQINSSLLGVGFRFQHYFTNDDTKLVMIFDIDEEGFIIYDRVRTELAPPVQLRLAIARKLLDLAEYFELQESLVTIFHPLNFFVHKDDGTVLVLYRGLKGQMPAIGYEEESIAEQAKRLILLLFTSCRYEELLLNGNAFAARRPLEEYRRVTKRLLQAKSIQEMRAVLDEEKQESPSEENRLAETETFSDKTNLFVEKRKFVDKQKVLLAGGLVASFLVVSGIVFAFANADDPEQKIPDQLMQGLRAATIQDYENASTAFDQLDFKSLTAEDQQVILQFYLTIGQVDKVNELDPSFIQKVAESNPSTPGLRFEKAVIKKDYRTITELENGIVLNQRRYEILVKAYIKLEKLKSAERVAKESRDPELIKLVEDAKQRQKVSEELQKVGKEVTGWIMQEKEKVENSMIMGVVVKVLDEIK